MYFEYFLSIDQVRANCITEIVSWLLYDEEYLKSNKNLCVGIFKYLDHDEIVGLKIVCLQT